MSTRVKIGIAAAIVAALIGLIVLDQRAATPVEKPPEPAAVPRDAGPAGILVESDIPRHIEGHLRQAGEEIDRQVQRVLGASPTPGPAPVASPSPTPAPALSPRPAALPAPAAETYEVKEGDMLYTIAERKYGDGNLWKLIADANPAVKPSALRVGAKLTIPPKPTATTAEPTPAASPTVEGGQRTYVIQPGDSLARIALRVYRKATFVDRIFEANRDVLDNVDRLVVGTKIVLPEFAAEPAAPVVTPGEAAPAADGRRTYRVRSGDSLWKIAERFRGQHGVLDMMRLIREANAEKLPSTGAMLQVDWVLVIPE